MRKTKHVVRLNITKFALSLKKIFPLNLIRAIKEKSTYKWCDVVSFVREVRKSEHTLRLT